jgi:hypothetical protein
MELQDTDNTLQRCSHELCRNLVTSEGNLCDSHDTTCGTSNFCTECNIVVDNRGHRDSMRCYNCYN